MDKNTLIVFLIDRSGSMMGLEIDTILGFNSFVDKQKKGDSNLLVSAILFDDKYELLYENEDATNVKLTNENYFVRGSTALYDAVGKSILDTSNYCEIEKPDSVYFIIITDGHENSSVEFKQEQIKQLIENKIKNDGWEFIFMGANIDEAKEAGSIGINPNRAFSYKTTSVGVEGMYTSLSESITSLREGE